MFSYVCNLSESEMAKVNAITKLCYIYLSLVISSFVYKVMILMFRFLSTVNTKEVIKISFGCFCFQNVYFFNIMFFIYFCYMFILLICLFCLVYGYFILIRTFKYYVKDKYLRFLIAFFVLVLICLLGSIIEPLKFKFAKSQINFINHQCSVVKLIHVKNVIVRKFFQFY